MLQKSRATKEGKQKANQNSQNESQKSQTPKKRKEHPCSLTAIQMVISTQSSLKKKVIKFDLNLYNFERKESINLEVSYQSIIYEKPKSPEKEEIIEDFFFFKDFQEFEPNERT